MSEPFALPRRAVLAGLGASALTGAAAAREFAAAPALAADLRRELDSAGIPGAGLAIVTRGRVDAFGLGLADVATGRHATGRSVFHTASVSKVVTAAALMRLVEAGRLSLDAPIAPLLDFTVANPAHPRDPITLRHLLQHRSSISDANYGPQFFRPGDAALSLRAFLADYLAPGGRHYAGERCYLPSPPGAQWRYSNIAIALAAYLAERVGRPLDPYSRATIFRPLQMRDASWRVADVPPDRLATGYARGAQGVPTPLPPTGYPDWPAGMLRASARDLGRFLAAFLPGSRPLLRPRTAAAMLRAETFPGFTPTINGQGLGWRRMPVLGRDLMGHTGSDPGAATGIYIDPASQAGAVVLLNLSVDDRVRAARDRIARRLLAAAGSP